jgi:hypothetical protein
MLHKMLKQDSAKDVAQDAKARCFALTGSETGSLPRFGVLIVCDAGGTNKYAGTEHLGQRWDMLDINAGQA